MYFWKIDALVRDLKSGNVSQRERFKYLLASVIVWAVSFELPVLFPEPVTPLGIVQSALMVAAAIIGTIYCYLVNAHGDDKEFIDRFVSIGWVVSVRLTVLFVSVYVVYSLVGYKLGGDSFARFSESINFVDVGFVLLMCGIGYWLIGKHIKKVAH